VAEATCWLCEHGNKRFLDGGVYWHSHKESNGYDYDNYTSPCGDQTAKTLEAYRKRELEILQANIDRAQEKLDALKSTRDGIKKAKTASSILRHMNLAGLNG